MEKKWKGALIGGIIGGACGLLLFFSDLPFKSELIKDFFNFIFQLNSFITGCEIHCYYMYVVYLGITMLFCSLIGFLLGLVVKKGWRSPK
jgi:hypothetical protein